MVLRDAERDDYSQARPIHAGRDFPISSRHGIGKTDSKICSAILSTMRREETDRKIVENYFPFLSDSRSSWNSELWMVRRYQKCKHTGFCGRHFCAFHRYVITRLCCSGKPHERKCTLITWCAKGNSSFEAAQPGENFTLPLRYHIFTIYLSSKRYFTERIFFAQFFNSSLSPGCFVFILAANIEESTTRWRDTVKRRNRWRYFLWWEFPLVLARRIELVEKKISPYILVWGEENSSKLRERSEENERKKYDRHSGDQSQCRHFVQVNDETDFSFRDSFFWIFLSETGKGRGGNWRLPMYIHLYFFKKDFIDACTYAYVYLVSTYVYSSKVTLNFAALYWETKQHVFGSGKFVAFFTNYWK